MTIFKKYKEISMCYDNDRQKSILRKFYSEKILYKSMKILKGKILMDT